MNAKHPSRQEQDEIAGLESALANFRQSVHAWSEAEYLRPRRLAEVPAHGKIWRRAAAWALGCVLAAGGLTAGVYQNHQRQLRMVAEQEEHARQLAAARAGSPSTPNASATDEEDLLARIDSDVSRQTPSALEPLAQLMDQDETQ